MRGAQTIVIDHLARLEDGSVAVAGVDGAHEHVAPYRAAPDAAGDTPSPDAAGALGFWDTAATRRGGGPFGVGEVVDIGFSRRRGEPPAVEDREVDETNLVAQGRLADGDFWSLMEIHGKDSLPQVFGDDLVTTPSGSASVPEGRGRASLGILRCPGPAELFVRGGQLRMGFDDLRLGSLDLAVFDYRLRDERGHPIESLSKVIRRRVAAGEPVILAVALSRAFNGAHWLRIDNLHFRDYFDDHPVFRFAR